MMLLSFRASEAQSRNLVAFTLDNARDVLDIARHDRTKWEWKQFDVAIVGGGPAGSSCAAFCALAGLRTLLLEREKFPREKVCGDCLNPSCWPVLGAAWCSRSACGICRILNYLSVEFIAIDGQKVIVDLPGGDDCEISVKRSLFDDLLLRRAARTSARTFASKPL